MSRCPKCQHELSHEDVQSGECPACGRSLTPLTGEKPETPGSRPKRQGDAGDKENADAKPGLLPDAISGAGHLGTGLTSSGEPETWDVDNNALTYEASDLMASERSASNIGPKPLDLDPDDIVRMSVLWGGVDDEVPSGMTIKSNDVDDDDENAATLDVAEMQHSEELAAGFEPKPPRAKDEGEESQLGETFISDEFPPVPATDDLEEGALGGRRPERHNAVGRSGLGFRKTRKASHPAR